MPRHHEMADAVRMSTRTPSLPPDLRSDCMRCAALCCAAYAFSFDDGFPLEKPANCDCPLLRANRRCSIYAHRASAGFAACVGFECYGAGQWVTRTHRANGKTHDEATLATFRRVLRIHELLALIYIAMPAMSDPAVRVEFDASRRALERRREESRATARSFTLGAERRRLLALIRNGQQCSSSLDDGVF